jgi:hydrogenase/urease accessory protein HupE
MRLVAVILVLVFRSASAHPEHPAGGPLGAGLMHLLGEPDHLAVLLLPLAAAAGLILRVRRHRRGRRARPPGSDCAAGRISRPQRR